MPASSVLLGPPGASGALPEVRVEAPRRSRAAARAVRSGARRSARPSAPKKTLISETSRSSGIGALGSASHASSAASPAGGDREAPAPASALLALLADQAGAAQGAGLGVELGVGDRPEVAHGDRVHAASGRRACWGPRRAGSRGPWTTWVSGWDLTIVRNRRYVSEHGNDRAGRHAGLTNLDDEVAVDELALEGELPTWLGGSLLRTGPARWDLGEQTRQPLVRRPGDAASLHDRLRPRLLRQPLPALQGVRGRERRPASGYSEFAHRPVPQRVPARRGLFDPALTDNGERSTSEDDGQVGRD